MAEYYSISQGEMSEFLSAQGFQPLSLPSVIELVWGKRADRDGQALSLRVFSGINPNGNSREVGKDAIRVEVYYRDSDNAIHRIGGSKRVHRVKGWKANLQNRIDQWQEGLGPKCPKCGAPMRLRKPKKGQTWKAFYGCVQWKPRNEGCSGTALYRPKKTTPKSKPKSRPRPAKQDVDGEMPWERDDRQHREVARDTNDDADRLTGT